MVSYPRYLPVAPRQHASWCASPANQQAYACSPVKRWLLAMLRMPAVPLRAFDRLRARRPPEGRPGRRNRRPQSNSGTDLKGKRRCFHHAVWPRQKAHHQAPPPSLRASWQPFTRRSGPIGRTFETFAFWLPARAAGCLGG